MVFFEERTKQRKLKKETDKKRISQMNTTNTNAMDVSDFVFFDQKYEDYYEEFPKLILETLFKSMNGFYS